MSAAFPLGKLPADVLARLLENIQPADPRVIVGPGIGLDAAVIDMGDRLLVAKSDPITFATDSIGWYAVQVNANDIATTGATARWFLATLLLPESHADAAMAESIFSQIHSACAAISVSLVGGHTEITYGLDRPIVVGAMLGEVTRDRLVRPSGAQPGDALLLTKGIAVEGTAIIARERDLRGLRPTGGWHDLKGLDVGFLTRSVWSCANRHPPRSFALAAANSSSLNTPAVCSCANCCNCVVRSVPAAWGAGAGGGAACCCCICICSSCCC